ncbi:MAG: hypothetical protein EBS90_12490, partial [Betaproteobacteria bacterium]|nr:hypothetical protein [Betaproteobacteria bacterium]
MRGQEQTATFKEDVPNARWVAEKVAEAEDAGLNRWGIPRYMGPVTGRFSRPLLVPTELLAPLRGERGEQDRPRAESLEYIAKHWDRLQNEAVYIEVDPFGQPWVSEGNHRIMVAARMGVPYVLAEVRYFSGSQKKAPAKWKPKKLLEADVRAAQQMTPNRPMSSQQLQRELLHLLNSPPDAYDFFPYIAEYAEEIGLDEDDPYAIADDPKAAAAFMRWVEANDIHGRWMREDPTSVPPKFTFSGAQALPPGVWLVHHSDADLHGFDRGATFERLGLSTWFTDKPRRGELNLDDELSPIERVYVFAFEPKNDPAISRFGLPFASQYGENWYLFRSDAAVAAY